LVEGVPDWQEQKNEPIYSQEYIYLC